MFEEYNDRLQEIIKKLEKNDTTIEEGTKLYEEGVTLAKKCYDILSSSKGKVTILNEELDKISDDTENDTIDD